MNQHGVKTYSSVVLVAGMCWLLYWFVEKYLLYWGLEYSGDVFLHTQISKSFYEGKGLFYDNIFAPASHIHNYFVLLLLAPFTFTWGALGLPLAHALINLWAFWYLLGTFKYDKTIWIGAVAFFLGPIAFWLTDDPAYGWHSELLFFPFSVLFACALVRQSPLAYLFGLLLTLNREDGPIVACAVHSVVLLSAGKRDRALLLRWLKVVALWVVIFALGMLFLKIVGDGANTRQGKVVQMGMRAWGEPELRNAVLEMLGGTLLLLLSGSLLLFVRGGPRVTGVVLLCGLPVLLVSLIASFAYLPK
ncbi:MAG: hypothetical protein KDD62_05280, partial [Bdellovibrionales bacterium]|nr:hypothetical protein [Bdellovibrionales bacterium]